MGEAKLLPLNYRYKMEFRKFRRDLNALERKFRKRPQTSEASREEVVQTFLREANAIFFFNVGFHHEDHNFALRRSCTRAIDLATKKLIAHCIDLEKRTNEQSGLRSLSAPLTTDTVFNILKYFLPKKARERIFEPYFEEIKEDKILVTKEKHGFFARKIIGFAFFSRIVIGFFQSYLAWIVGAFGKFVPSLSKFLGLGGGSQEE